MSITAFPTELLIHIFSFLPWQDHLTASQVCNLWSSIFLSQPTKSYRYLHMNPQTSLCPQMHNLFRDIGLECTIDIFTGQISKIIFIRNETEGLQTDQDRQEATIDLTNSKILKEQLFHFQGWRYEHDIKEKEWRMGICVMWNQLGYEYGGHKDRQIYRQDWFSFVKADEGDVEVGSDIIRGEVDLDISVKGFINVLGRHVLKFDALKIPGKHEMRLRLGMYDRMGIVVIRNVHEVSKVFDLSFDPLHGMYVDKDRIWVNK
ncbi:uncharacterized protein DFL_006577 [Arthrobotrys flagrans]|uniref:F-box domain-containing protein n=1 Tax=Arthrobotrys flagrans TaxID=97331 RepID=A0A436ZTS6_ARTFL|nr:hypothetical protein DFL_006577 [Arthrobotrys flagrans]